LKSLLYLPFDLQAHHPLWATLNLYGQYPETF
jgi:hypothetical protein